MQFYGSVPLVTGDLSVFANQTVLKPLNVLDGYTVLNNAVFDVGAEDLRVISNT